MPLVFVHGVNVRYAPGSDPFVQARDALFRRSVLSQLVADAGAALIVNPYWGDAAAQFPWQHGGLPEGRYEQLGAEDLIAASAINDLAPQRLPATAGPEDAPAAGKSFDPLIDPETLLPALASQSLEVALDALWVVAAENLSSELATELADLSVRAGEYALEHPRPAWALAAKDNDEFISRLFRILEEEAKVGVGGREKFGFDRVRNALRAAGDRLRVSVSKIANVAGSGARRVADAMLLKVRAPVHRSVATFMGDVLVYFRQREAGNSEVATIVADALEQADVRAPSHRRAADRRGA